MIRQTLLMLLFPVLAYVVLFLIPESRESLSIYLFSRALHRINEVPTVTHRFYILIRLASELIPPVILTVLFLTIGSKSNQQQYHFDLRRKSLLFISIGMAASLPLMLTMVQKGFYFVPALPFFAIGFSLLIAPVINSLIERLDQRRKLYRLLFLCSFLLFIATIFYSCMQIGKTRRYRELIHDVYEIGKVVPEKSIVSIPAELWNEWDLQCYLMRYFNISLEIGNNKSYYILDKTMQADSVRGFEKVTLSTQQYDLYVAK